ncbi:hypothetical protein MKW98_026665 [Papaver atlanticum]|uniref:Uncharacterized protein n=1 Tax=Papaver atlanticum TaxID=357466 RepID=A0AAD4X5K5_9MAGN|nr:hypothetical protein MKW98_026665 [Papaver atlanticum]
MFKQELSLLVPWELHTDMRWVIHMANEERIRNLTKACIRVGQLEVYRHKVMRIGMIILSENWVMEQEVQVLLHGALTIKKSKHAISILSSIWDFGDLRKVT